MSVWNVEQTLGSILVHGWRDFNMIGQNGSHFKTTYSDSFLTLYKSRYLVLGMSSFGLHNCFNPSRHTFYLKQPTKLGIKIPISQMKLQPKADTMIYRVDSNLSCLGWGRPRELDWSSLVVPLALYTKLYVYTNTYRISPYSIPVRVRVSHSGN